ncbi:MAG: hypothetical protein ACRC2K_03425, partial [Clostridium sp.]
EEKMVSSYGEEQLLVKSQPSPKYIIENKYGAAPSPLQSNPNTITNYYVAQHYSIGEIIGINSGYNVIKISKENLDINNIALAYNLGDSEEKIVYASGYGIEPSKNEKNSNEAYFNIPAKAENIRFINNTNIDVIADDFHIYMYE